MHLHETKLTTDTNCSKWGDRCFDRFINRGADSEGSEQKHRSLKMASSMPFGPSYNEPANPRAAQARACITAAATTMTSEQSHSAPDKCHKLQTNQRKTKNAFHSQRSSVPLALRIRLYAHSQFSRSGLTHLLAASPSRLANTGCLSNEGPL